MGISVPEIDLIIAPKLGAPGVRISSDELVTKRFRVCHDQPFLLPPSLQDWLPENHLARFIAEFITRC